jgi:hypothetical protein
MSASVEVDFVKLLLQWYEKEKQKDAGNTAPKPEPVVK